MTMKPRRLLAFDLGSSGGRALWGTYDGGRLSMEVLHTFPNGPVRMHGGWYWDMLRLVSEVEEGVRAAVRKSGGEPFTIGVDTWGVDVALVDETGQILGNVHNYRDPRTEGLYDEIFPLLSREEIYATTGIMFIQFNTLVQLFAEKKSRPWVLERARRLFFPPDFFNWVLTGKCVSERTIASTSQFLDPGTGEWARGLLERLGIPHHFLCPIVAPGTVLGPLTPEVRSLTGAPESVRVVAVGGHDTASAFYATPAVGPDCAFISAGTWSLLGRELATPERSGASMDANFSNECGVGDTIAYNKILGGLWLIQECRRCWRGEGNDLSFADIHAAARDAEGLRFVFDPDDARFMNPDNMPREIAAWFTDRGEDAPRTVAEIARSVYESLALNHALAIADMERIFGRPVTAVHIVSGGSQAELLCRFTADASGLPVHAGPVEATAVGNMLSQLVATGDVSGTKEGREIVGRSYDIATYEPGRDGKWDAALRKLRAARG